MSDYQSIPSHLTIKKKDAKEKMSSLEKEVQALAEKAGSSATEDQNNKL